MALSTAAVAGLALAGIAALATPSHADPGSCDTAYPVDSLTQGQAVTGLTVTSGTTPGQFTGSIIGVLKDGIGPDTDMVIAQLSSPEIQDDGIWEGMSGSPVYDQATGQLIGAVAYTLSWGETGVAGITPWADMQKYAGDASPQTVKVPASAAREIARATSVSVKQASQGFHEVATPRLVSGLSQRALDRADASKHAKRFLTGGVSAAGRTSAGDVTPADMVAGGNLVATESTGDILQGGLGTITSVCNDRVVGFGHPMNFTGASTYGMAGADTLYIQGDSLGASFKVANIGDVLGTVDQDRTTGISGPLGTTPTSIPITSTIDYTSGGTTHSRTGTSEVQLPEAAAVTAYYEQLANHQAVLDAYQGGTEQQTWSVTGHTSSGPFHFTGGNIYTDSQDIADASSYDVADLTWLLSHVAGVTIDGITIHSTVTDSTATLKISGLQQHLGGKWVTLGKGKPAMVKAGKKLTLRLQFVGGKTGKPVHVSIPKKAAHQEGRLVTFPSDGYPFERGNPHQLSGVKKLVDNAQRNDQAQIATVIYSKRRPAVSFSTTPREGMVITGRYHEYRLIVG